MTQGLPDPLVPADVDLRGLEYMPFFGNHLFGSEFNARCSDSEWRAGVTLWWAAWNQVPAASLPDDDVALARLADLGRDVKGWRKVKARALHGFVLCSDGRLYHRFLAPQALVAWDKRVKEREKKRRWREGRDRDKGGGGPGQEPGPQGLGDRDRNVDTGGDGTADVTGSDGTGRDGTSANPLSAYSTASTVDLAIVLRAAGVSNASATNPDVLRWAEEGVSVEIAKEGARIAIEERRKATPSTRYLVGIIEDLRRRQPAALSGTAGAIATLESMKS